MKDGHPQEPGRRLNLLRGRGKAAAGAVGSDGIVLAPPLLDQHGRLRQRVEDLPVQQLVPELAGTGQTGEQDGPALEATFTRPNGIGVSTGGRELWVNDLTEQPATGRGVSVVTLRRIRLITLTDVLSQIDLSEGADRVREVYAAYHEVRDSEDTSAEAVALAYQWFQTPYVAEAVVLFELSSDRFPESAFAQFQRGEAYRYTGQPQQAAEYYRRALDFQPDHAQAAARLAQVTGG